VFRADFDVWFCTFCTARYESHSRKNLTRNAARHQLKTLAILLATYNPDKSGKTRAM